MALPRTELADAVLGLFAGGLGSALTFFAPRRMGESGADYLARIQEEGFLRRQRHPGNFAFSWTLK